MERRRFINLSAASLAAISLPRLPIPTSLTAAGPVSFRSLMEEMTDHSFLARWPDKSWRSMQASALQTKDRHNPGQFGNKAIGHFVRVEEKADGRREWVLMEHDGPGAIVRMWAPNMAKDAIFRIYFDGSRIPAVEVNMMDLFYGKAFVPPPFAALKARGGNVYLPIPFSTGCKVTVDKNECGWAQPPDLFYIIQYRAYDKGVTVRTFDPAALTEEGALLTSAAQALHPQNIPPSTKKIIDTTLAPGQSVRTTLRKGAAAIDYLELHVGAGDRTKALRNTFLQMSFDGHATVDCPVGDFFGSGAGLNPFSDWVRKVEKDGTMSCRWIMPYKSTARLRLLCSGPEPVKVTLSASCRSWDWDHRSMYFHAGWRWDKGIDNLPVPNFNFISVQGKGIYVGDTLNITSYSPKWWGEGPEKIAIDGEPFPSQFGTGSEDYYGYAWGEREIFDAPFHAQPKIPEGPEFQGTTVNTRVRSLDAIPFRTSLELNLEVLTQGSMAGIPSKLDYGVAAYWYGFAGITGGPKGLLAIPAKKNSALQRRLQDYSCMWWANGVRSQQKIFNIQTGFYGLSFDYGALALRKMGMLSSFATEEAVLRQNNAVIESLPSMEMEVFLVHQGRRQTVKSSGDIEDCQLVESGAYFQRRWMPSLQFGEDIATAAAFSGLELAAWPEKFILTLQVRPDVDWKDVKAGMRFTFSEGKIPGQDWEITSPHPIVHKDGAIEIAFEKEHWQSGETITIPITFSLIKANSSDGLVSIHAQDAFPAPNDLPVIYDPVCGWHEIPLADKCTVTLKNNAASAQSIHLNFHKEASVDHIPGICSVLCDMEGEPLALPVQVSKDWHDKPARFSGQWYHGICVIHLDAGQEVSFLCHTVHNTWNGLPAASMSQLCLIGWGHNQLWLQSAIGSWGESITFEPDQTHGKGLVLDSRPLAVWGMGNRPDIKWSWTHNMGGADFLVYYDENNIKRWPGRTKTRITRYGPLLSTAAASSTTDNGKMTLDYDCSLYGTDDYVRGIYRFRITARQQVRFTRLVIFQCGSDDYNYTAEKKMAIGNADGLIKEWDTHWGDNVYRTSPMPLEGDTPWISLHEAVRLVKEQGAIANRGVVIREWKAVIDGRPVLPYAAERGTFASGNNTSQIDIMLPPDVRQLEAGDHIEGLIEHIIMPQFASDYFGLNQALPAALKTYGNTWKMIHREVRENTPEIDVKQGALLSFWPVRIRYEGHPLLFSITGGLAYLPVTFTGLPAATGFVLEEWIQGQWKNALSDGKSHGWQADPDMSSGLVEITYTLLMDGPLRQHTRKFRLS